MRWIVTLIFVLSGSFSAFAQVDYSDRIQPIFDTHCTGCHGASQRSGVNLTNYDAVMNSVGENYDTLIVIPEKPDDSPLVDVIENEEPAESDPMPPGDPLDSAEIADIRAWIEEGAKESISTSSPRQELIAEGFELQGNFPNPFNPVTHIRFNLPTRAEYSIEVFSISGEKVSRFDGESSAGLVTVPVDLSRQPSGIYIYRVTAKTPDGHSARLSGRMVLMK